MSLIDYLTQQSQISSGDIEEYYTFTTVESYNSIKNWMDFHASYGEKITGESRVMRDLWQTTNKKSWSNNTHPVLRMLIRTSLQNQFL
jgi:hypothetical protein